MSCCKDNNTAAVNSMEELSAVKAAESEDDLLRKSMKECVKLEKIYDWVKLLADQNVPVDIPADDIAAVTAAVEAGHGLDIVNLIDLAKIESSITNIDQIDDQTACVSFAKIVPSTVIITDVVTGKVLSKFPVVAQVFDSTDLCFPIGMPKSAIEITVVEVEALALSTTPFGGRLTFEYSLCQEIVVSLEIFAEIKIQGFCASRQGTKCRGSVVCKAGSATYPKQCTGV